MQCVISEAMAASKSNPAAASLACSAIQALKAKVCRPTSGQPPTALGSTGGGLTRLDLSRLWLQAWLRQQPAGREGGSSLRTEGGGTRVKQPGGSSMGLEQWLNAAVDELFLVCCELGDRQDEVRHGAASSSIGFS